MSNEPFPEPLSMGYLYGAAYTFEYEIEGVKSWTIFYDGQIVDSLHQPVSLDKITLFLEQNDRYVEVGNVSTGENGEFYLSHQVFGSIEKNALIKILVEENGFYRELIYEEYAGLELVPENGSRYFHDDDFNSYPDWPYSLYDLLNRTFQSAMPFQPQSFNFTAGFFDNPLINAIFEASFR